MQRSIVGHVPPPAGSLVQSAAQQSPEVALPSSHCSPLPASMTVSPQQGAGAVDVRLPVKGIVADNVHDGTQLAGGGTQLEYSDCVAVSEPSAATVPVMVIEQ